MNDFLRRLKQSKLVQWAIAYVAFAFALIQVLDVVSDSYGWPRAVMHIAFGVLALGFVVLLLLAWYHGERGAQRISGPELLLIALVLAVGGGLLWHFARAPPNGIAANAVASARSAGAAQRKQGTSSPDSAAGAAASRLPTASAAALKPPAASIMVLPFTNLSDDPKQAYFSDGITEELTNALGQNTDLTVIAWDTASRYAHSKLTPKQIGKALNVAQVLAGSIQREGDAVRVTTELIDTADGRQLWSAHYDDSFQNIFVVQDKITAAIADALKVKFAGLQASPTLNPQAHELYLKGLAAMERITAAETEAARADFEAALKLDPDYADAWAGLADAYNGLSEWSTLPLQEAQPKMRAAAEKALALDPHNVNALVQLGNADANDHRIVKARSEYEQALALDPSNARAHVDYGTVLPLKSAIAQTQEATMLDPKSTLAWGNLATQDQALADWPQELAALRVMVKLSPHEIDAAFYLAFAYQQLQRGQDAVAAFDQVKPASSLDKQLVDAGRLTYQSRLKPALRAQALAALDRLRRAKLSPFAQFDLLQLYLALDETEPVLQMLPRSCAIARDACNDLAIDPLYRPLHGDPRFEKLSKQYTIMTVSTTPASASSR